jgi:hypothetical protein
MHALERRRGLVDVARRRRAEPVRRTLHCDRQWVNATERADARGADAPRSPASRASASSPRLLLLPARGTWSSPTTSIRVSTPPLRTRPRSPAARARTRRTARPPRTPRVSWAPYAGARARAGGARGRRGRERGLARGAREERVGHVRERSLGEQPPGRGAAGELSARAPAPVDRRLRVVRHRAGARMMAGAAMDGRREGRPMGRRARGEGRRGEVRYFCCQ